MIGDYLQDDIAYVIPLNNNLQVVLENLKLRFEKAEHLVKRIGDVPGYSRYVLGLRIYLYKFCRLYVRLISMLHFPERNTCDFD
jgi:hypothetical protein